MNKKQVIKTLRYNIKLAKSCLKQKHTREFILETRGLISGYEFAIALIKQEL